MASFNKVILMGNLTRDPELRHTAAGTAVTDLRLAVNRSFKGRDGERKEEVLYVDVTVWDRSAVNCCQYLKKGRPVHVEGFLKEESWDDKATGEKKTKMKVQADSVQFLGSRDAPGGGSGDDEYSAPAPSSSPSPRRAAPAEPRSMGNGPSRGGYNSAPAPAASTRRPPAPPADSEPDDDDIPF